MKQSKSASRQGPSKEPVTHDKADVPLEKRVGEVIKHLRLSANLTLADLSAGAGMSSAMLSRVENGMATASLDSLERLCHALGVNLSDPPPSEPPAFLDSKASEPMTPGPQTICGQPPDRVRYATKLASLSLIVTNQNEPRRILDLTITLRNRAERQKRNQQ